MKWSDVRPPLKKVVSRLKRLPKMGVVWRWPTQSVRVFQLKTVLATAALFQWSLICDEDGKNGTSTLTNADREEQSAQADVPKQSAQTKVSKQSARTEVFEQSAQTEVFVLHIILDCMKSEGWWRAVCARPNLCGAAVLCSVRKWLWQVQQISRARVELQMAPARVKRAGDKLQPRRACAKSGAPMDQWQQQAVDFLEFEGLRKSKLDADERRVFLIQQLKTLCAQVGAEVPVPLQRLDVAELEQLQRWRSEERYQRFCEHTLRRALK